MKPKAYSYIRLSSKEQLKGDSERRQYEATMTYCEDKGYQIVFIHELGVSAFHGKHRTEGKLKTFLEFVESGKIEKDSIFVVENLDRLSRENVPIALGQFMSLINAGIKIVTLQDKKEYDKSSIEQNWTELVISITYMARAHEESKVKSERLKATLAQKREMARNGKRKFTGNTPAWLKYLPDKDDYIPIPPVCNAIEKIFQMKLEGKSTYAIEKELNMLDDKIIWKPPITKRNKTGGWRESYIKKLLYNNRALIGEFQPHVIKDGKRVPEGPPIKNYFPAVIDRGLFEQVQILIERNAKSRGQGGGQKKRNSNLFIHIAQCGLCGSPMHYLDKGKPPKGQKYLMCDASRRKLEQGKKCQARAIRYDKFEERFFWAIDELKLEQIIGINSERLQRLHSLQRQMENLKYRIKEIDEQISSFNKAIGETKNDSVRLKFVQEIEKLTEEDEKLFNDRKELNNSIKELSEVEETIENKIKEIKSFYDLMRKTKSDEKKSTIRFQVNQLIKKLIKEIRIVPHLNKDEALKYFKPKYDRFMEKYEKIKSKRFGVKHSSYQKMMERMQNDQTNDRAYYGVAYITWNNQEKSNTTSFHFNGT